MLFLTACNDSAFALISLFLHLPCVPPETFLRASPSPCPFLQPLKWPRFQCTGNCRRKPELWPHRVLQAVSRNLSCSAGSRKPTISSILSIVTTSSLIDQTKCRISDGGHLKKCSTFVQLGR